MTQTIQAVRGMNDILPQDGRAGSASRTRCAPGVRSYGYRNIRTPIVEPTALFVRAIGEVTDIVEKEMYSFVDELNGEDLTLRPEATADRARATIEHSLLYGGPQRLWYMGPMFRHERPQKGRYRQFHQVGVEALGVPGPDVDAELILMCARLWGDLGLDGIRLHLNSLGSPEERRAHRESLGAYLEQHEAELDEDSRRRLVTNPLRVLDRKNPALQALIREPAAARLSGRSVAQALRGRAGRAEGRGDPLHHRPPPGARPRLLQPHGVRVDHRPARAQGTVCGAVATTACSRRSAASPPPRPVSPWVSSG